jgi:hypothetical protein
VKRLGIRVEQITTALNSISDANSLLKKIFGACLQPQDHLQIPSAGLGNTEAHCLSKIRSRVAWLLVSHTLRANKWTPHSAIVGTAYHPAGRSYERESLGESCHECTAVALANHKRRGYQSEQTVCCTAEASVIYRTLLESSNQ